MLSVLTSMAAPLQGDGDAGILFGRQGSLSPIDTGFSFFIYHIYSFIHMRVLSDRRGVGLRK